MAWFTGLAGGWGRKAALPRLLGLAVLIGLTLLKYSDPLPLERLRLAVFDRYLAAKPRLIDERPVVIIDIDENVTSGHRPMALVACGNGAAARPLTEAGVVTTGFDIVFAEPDRLSPRPMG